MTLAFGHRRPIARRAVPAELRPALLVSYWYLDNFLATRSRGLYYYRDLALDSGAYSAANSGAAIDLDDYIARARALAAEDPTLVEIFALDVIGDWRASLRNTERMWQAWIEAIPCFHWGEPEDVLVGLARDYPKIALGGMLKLRSGTKFDWARQCFDRVWPKRIHGFGLCSERVLLGLPFDSVDATNWEVGPCKFGRWRTMGNASWRGIQQNLRAEVASYLDLEARARERWRGVWAEVGPTLPPTVRLVCKGDVQAARRGLASSIVAPTLRLACAGSGQAEKNGSLSGGARNQNLSERGSL